MAQVEQQAKFVSRRLEVVMYLGAVLVGEGRHGLDFYDYLFVANEVGDIELLRVTALVL